MNILEQRKKISDPISRFLTYLKNVGDCVEWDGPLNSYGYGIFNFKGRKYAAHRMAWEMEKGTISKNLEVCHKCDNPKCVNVDHLFVGTHQDNMTDMVNKKRLKGKSGSTNLQAKLNEDQVKEIRMLKDEGIYGTDIAKKFKISHRLVYAICNRQAWRHLQ